MKKIELKAASWKQLVTKAKELKFNHVGLPTAQLVAKIKSLTNQDYLEVDDSEVVEPEKVAKPKIVEKAVKEKPEKTEKEKPAKEAKKEKVAKFPSTPKKSLAIMIWEKHLAGVEKNQICVDLTANKGFVYNVIRAYTASEHLRERAKKAI